MAHGPQPPRRWPRPGPMPAPWAWGHPGRRAVRAARGGRGQRAVRVSCHIDTAGRLGSDVKPERGRCLPWRQRVIRATHEFGSATHPLDQNLRTSRSTVGLTVRGCRNGRKAASDPGSGPRTPDRARGHSPAPGTRPRTPGGPDPERPRPRTPGGPRPRLTPTPERGHSPPSTATPLSSADATIQPRVSVAT